MAALLVHFRAGIVDNFDVMCTRDAQEMLKPNDRFSSTARVGQLRDFILLLLVLHTYQNIIDEIYLEGATLNTYVRYSQLIQSA